MRDKKIENTGNNSYFSSARRSRRSVIMKVIIPAAVAAIILGVVFVTQASQQGLGKKMVMHVHPQLNIKVDGKPIPVPQMIGIDRSLYMDHSLDKYGMQGMAPLHTHDSNGTVHVESTVNKDYTLGEFLDIWGGLNTNGKVVKATVNGQPVSDYKNIILKDREQINLEIE